jgi:hydroxymethylglutaryl-CoA lyase
MVFGDPWEGRVEPAVVAEIGAALQRAGCATISLGDTIGVATPGQVGTVVSALDNAGVPSSTLALHAHDTYGQALANVHAALLAGVTEFDSSIGGLGRCPYAPGATGNVATEDLIWMLHGMGIETGLNLDALVATSAWMAQQMGRTAIASRVATALLAA